MIGPTLGNVDTTRARAYVLIDRLFAAHGGSVRASVLVDEVTLEVARLELRDPDLFSLFQQAGVLQIVNDCMFRPLPPAETARLLRSTGMIVPEIH